MVFTDHKSLLCQLQSASGEYLPRKICHLDIVPQFAVSIKHVFELDNPAADVLSRIHQHRLSATPRFGLSAVAQAQVIESAIDQIPQESSSNLEAAPITASQNTSLCDIFQGRPKPVALADRRRPTFVALHNLTRQGVARD